jgi:ectoine hydroxylase-related dioxygenase (phytanoyl-CoA dioxygenase family)
MTDALTQEQIEEYQRKGYLRVRAVFNAEEVAAWEAESRRLLTLGLAHADNWRAVSYRMETGLAIVDRLNPVIDISPLFASLVADERILRPLRELYDEEMLLFKDKLIYKMPGVPGYPAHQDYALWQTFPRPLANVIVSIDAARAENGGVEFFEGHHERLLSTTGEQRFMNADEIARLDTEASEVVETEPGDIVIFDGMTPHRSGVNLSNTLRRQLYLTYSSARKGDLYQEQLRAHEAQERARRGPSAERTFFR